MEKIAKITVFLLTLFTSVCYSQENLIVKKGLLSSQATLSTSKMLNGNESLFYLHCGFEGFVSDKISLTGEGYYNLGNLSSDESLFKFNHNLFFGASKHFTKNNHDLYIGLQPGVSIIKLNADVIGFENTKTGVNPVFSTVAGYNFYVNKIFHFFVQTRYIAGEHNYDIHQNVSEFRFSAGLGFNLNTM